MKGYFDGPTDGPLSEAEEAMNDAIASGELDDELTDAAADGDTANALEAAGFDIEAFKRQCLGVWAGLRQDQVWRDAQGRLHRIEEMSVRYKANCLRFQRRRAARLKELYIWGEMYALELPSGWSDPMQGGHLGEDGQPVGGRSLSRAEFMLDNGGNMSHAFDQYIESLEAADPADWLETTPLMRRLSDDVAHNRGGEDD